MNRLRLRKHITALSILLFAASLFAAAYGKRAYAASAMIEFSVREDSVKVGDTFTVIMDVTSSDSTITGVDAYVSYDSSQMEFVSGGKYVSGNAGLLHVEAAELDSEKSRVKFSLQFKAVSSGNSAINISDKAVITADNGKEMSTSSNRISVEIKGAPGAAPTSGPTQPVSGISLSSDNSLVSLKVNEGVLEPLFSPDVTKYSISVDNTVDNIYISFTASDPAAAVRLDGNEGLVDGNNKVKVIVTAQDKSEKVYVINVNRETYAETEERLKKESGNNEGITFAVKAENGRVMLQNSYSFEIVDVEQSDLVPAGYKKTSVLLYGVNVTAYTASSNLDSDYLLMYCKNESGDCEFYQFDRQEKTLQRYTGDLIDKINATEGTVTDAAVMTSNEYKKNLSQMAIIIAVLVGFCVLLIIAMISVLLKQVKSKSKRIEDELDF